MDRAVVEQLFRLNVAQPWLEKRQSELLATMDLCQSIDEQALICDLLFRFKYIPANSLDEALGSGPIKSLASAAIV